jgi:hypothetical protein
LVQEAILPARPIDSYDLLWTAGWKDGRWGSAILSRVGALTLEWEDRSRGAVVLGRCSVGALGEVRVASVHARVQLEDDIVAPVVDLWSKDLDLLASGEGAFLQDLGDKDMLQQILAVV